MGKASRWIRSFLVGKKDERDKKTESLVIRDTILSFTGRKEKRRWSFKRLGNPDAMPISAHKRCGSFDSSFTTTHQLVKQALQECDTEQIRGIILGKSSNEVVETASPAASPLKRLLEDEAATKIQAVFRSYLARKALRALKGLVKIQALVRGYLVRKQTTETIKCMHALMAIQRRARAQRVQMNEETQTVCKRGLTHEESSNENQFIAAYNEKMELKVNELEGASKRHDTEINQLSLRIAGTSCTRLPFMYHSGRHSTSDMEHRQQLYSTQSTLPTNNNSQIAEFSLNTPHRISQHNSKVSKTKPYKENSNPTMWDCHFAPTYMSKTESSRAKTRSKSEPKRRPKWGIKQKSKTSTSTESMNVNHIEQEKQQYYPWLIKLHQSARSSIDSRCDSNSSSRNLIPYQPPISLY